MRRNVVIGLVGTAIMTGGLLWPTTANAQEAWVLWRYTRWDTYDRATGGNPDNRQVYQPVTGSPDYNSCMADSEKWVAFDEKGLNQIQAGALTVMTDGPEKQLIFNFTLMPSAIISGYTITTFPCFPASLDPRPRILQPQQNSTVQPDPAASDDNPLRPLSPERLRQELLLRRFGDRR